MPKKKIKRLIKKVKPLKYKPKKKIYSKKSVIKRAGARLKALFSRKKYTNPKRLKKGLTKEQIAQFARGKRNDRT